jgi:four helix bundle protein
MMKNYKKLKMWQMGMDIAKMTFSLSRMLPIQEKFGLIGQINRAAISIPSNIAEGSSRNSDKDYKRFIEIALGSTFELETQLLLIKQLELADSEKTDQLIDLIIFEQKMLSRFINHLNQT